MLHVPTFQYSIPQYFYLLHETLTLIFLLLCSYKFKQYAKFFWLILRNCFALAHTEFVYLKLTMPFIAYLPIGY